MTINSGLEADSNKQPDEPILDATGSRKRPLGCLLEVVETLVLTVVIFLVIQTFVAQPFRVEGASMETTVLPDQYVLIDKLTPHWAAYARGDIVVLHPPSRRLEAGGTPFIKRVIGLPGDHVELRDGIVYVNSAPLDEPYIYTDGGIRQPTDPVDGGPSEWLVPAGAVLVMGDHRQDSSDSRTFGPVEISQVIGRAWLRYWPLDAFGTLAAPGYPAADPSALHSDVSIDCGPITDRALCQKAVEVAAAAKVNSPPVVAAKVRRPRPGDDCMTFAPRCGDDAVIVVIQSGDTLQDVPLIPSGSSWVLLEELHEAAHVDQAR